MNSEFLKYYKQIVIEGTQQKQNTARKKQQDKKPTVQIKQTSMTQQFEDAKKEAITAVENCNDEIANAAFHQINTAYNKNPALFDDPKKEQPNKTINQDKTQKKTPITNINTNTNTNTNTDTNKSSTNSANTNTSTNNNVKVTHRDENGNASGIETSGRNY